MPIKDPKILLCSPVLFSTKLGTGRGFHEIGEALSRSNWEVQYLSPTELQLTTGYSNTDFRKALHYFLRSNSSRYDVIEFEHSTLPYPRSHFCPRTLLVARSHNLTHALISMSPPEGPFAYQMRSFFFLRSMRNQFYFRRLLQQSIDTLNCADLIALSNKVDKETLQSMGHPPEKLLLSPLGLWADRAAKIANEHKPPSSNPVVAFLGTFDYRKGAADLLEIFSNIITQFPLTTFRLLGTAGLFPTKDSVEQFFPKSIRSKIEVIPRFEPEDLPKLLSDAWCGIFPSYYDSFGYGVLEMLAAGIPVIAYASAGPSEMLLEKYMVRIGAADSLGEKICSLLGDREALERASQWAKNRALDFTWEKLGPELSKNYLTALDRRRNESG